MLCMETVDVEYVQRLKWKRDIPFPHLFLFQWKNSMEKSVSSRPEPAAIALVSIGEPPCYKQTGTDFLKYFLLS